MDRQTDKQSDGQTNKQIDGTNVHEGYQLKSPYDLIFEVHGYTCIYCYVLTILNCKKRQSRLEEIMTEDL